MYCRVYHACRKIINGNLIRDGGASNFSKFSTKCASSFIMTSKTQPASREDPAIVKLDTPQFKAIFNPELRLLENIFQKYGYEIRIAGGAVRDILLGKTPTDLDFATTATPDQMKEMFNAENIRMLNTTGEKHGTITARINDNSNFEVTTLRVDTATDGRHAIVEFTKDWKLDANRRDLTINSMFLGLDGTVYDYFYGYDDLIKRRVVFVGDPAERITEDYLRILRYFRFYGRIADRSDDHDQITLEAIEKHASGLERISGERIWSELCKILLGNFACQLVLAMLRVGLAPYIGLPKDGGNQAEFQKVCNKAVGQPCKAITLLTGLFETDEQLLIFHQRCKLSSYDRDLGLFLIYHRNDDLTLKPDPLKQYKVLIAAGNSKVNKKNMKEYCEQLFMYTGRADLIKEFEEWEIPQFPLNGRALIDCGVERGKLMGQLLEELKIEWALDDFRKSKEELLARVPDLVDDMKSRNKCKKPS